MILCGISSDGTEAFTKRHFSKEWMFHCLYKFSWGKFWHSIIGYPFNSIQVMLNIRSVDGVLPPNEGTSDSNSIGGYVSICYFTNRVQLYVNTFWKHIHLYICIHLQNCSYSSLDIDPTNGTSRLMGCYLQGATRSWSVLKGLELQWERTICWKTRSKIILNDHIVTRFIIFQI